MPAPFVELRALSAFSFGDGAVAPEVLAERARALGYHALGLTDRADLGGIVRFAMTCRSVQLVPIVGAELLVDGFPLALLVRSAVGFNNLAALITRARVGPLESWTRQGATRGRPQVSWEDVALRNEGLHLLSGPPSGALAQALRERRFERADHLLASYRSAFGDRVAVEVHFHSAGRSEAALAGAQVALAQQRRIPWFPTTNPRYVDEGSRLVHDTLTALRHNTTVAEATARGLLHPNGEWRLIDPKTMAGRLRGAEAGLETTLRLARECAFDYRWIRPPLPKFETPEGHDDDSLLRQLAFEGAAERWKEGLNDKHRHQLEHELAIIKRLGYSGFFLVMWDAVREAHQRGILAQGRGSAANSTVAYCLGITPIDPVREGLLFERFLSDARVDGQTEAPDIDVDFEHERREEMLEYVYAKYQRPRAAITGVTQIYSACTAIQDAMRAHGYPAELAFRLSKRLRRADCLGGVKKLREGLAAAQGFDLSEPRAEAVLATMAACQDLPRLRSTHPGGFVLSSAPLGNYLPIESTSMGRTIIQFDKDDLDYLGIPKFDFLGLGALTVVQLAFRNIEARTGRRLEMYQLKTDDAATYALISKGETIGTFQIESRAQIASILHTKPERLYDIVVQVALIRPGPIQARFVGPYTRRRRGQEIVTYLHPKLEPILERTQGIPIFQEQAMSIAMALAGYSAGDADLLRRTMGHYRKLPRLEAALEELRRRLIENGITEDVAEQIRDDLTSFANYGFPESHAWSFALIAYATAYLKCHYPTELLLGLLNAQPMGFYPIATLIHDAKRHGVRVVGPCLALGAADCTVEGIEPDHYLRLGWRFVRGIKTQAVEALGAARVGGPFTGIGDVIRRAGMTRRDAIALARAGAFGVWEPDRRRAAWEAIRHVGAPMPLAPSHALPHHPRALGRTERIFLDYFATGSSLEGHPVEHLRARLAQAGALDSSALGQAAHGVPALVGGLVVTRQQPASAGGVLFVLLEDELGFLNVIVRKELDPASQEAARHARFLLVTGAVQRDGPVVHVVAERVKEIRPKRALAFTSHDFR